MRSEEGGRYQRTHLGLKTLAKELATAQGDVRIQERVDLKHETHALGGSTRLLLLLTLAVLVGLELLVHRAYVEDDVAKERLEEAQERQLHASLHRRVGISVTLVVSRQQQHVVRKGRRCPQWPKELRVGVHELLSCEHLLHVGFEAPNQRLWEA